MESEITHALAPLAGREARTFGRALDTLVVHFGAAGGDPATNGDGAAAGVLRISCPWRLTEADHVLVGSGDLFAPADPAEEPETFDWEPPGASWLDVRLGELAARFQRAPLVVAAITADALGGVRFAFASGPVLELFPNSTPTGHVSTEFWRLASPADPTRDFVVGTFGAEREARA